MAIDISLPFDGTAGGKVFTDLAPSPKMQTVADTGIALSATQSKFGGVSAFLNGGYIAFGASAAGGPAFGAQNFCIRGWLYDVGSGARRCLLGNNTSSGVGGTLSAFILGTSLYSISVVVGGTTYSMPTASAPTGAWYHFALCRNGSNLTLYINGASVSTVSVGSGSIASGGGLFSLGSAGEYRVYGTSSGTQWMGYIDDFQLILGDAVYTANFTAPAVPNARVHLSGNVKNAAGANVARTVRAYRDDTGALVGGTVSDGTSGNYAIGTTVPTAHTIIAFPAAGESLPALTLSGVIPV